MGLIRLRVRELAQEKGWTLKEVSDRTGIPYSTVKKYAQAPKMATVDYTALQNEWAGGAPPATHVDIFAGGVRVEFTNTKFHNGRSVTVTPDASGVAPPAPARACLVARGRPCHHHSGAHACRFG